MWVRDSEISMRSPVSFDMLYLKVQESYTILRRDEHQAEYLPHEPETYTNEEFYEKLSEAGTVVRTEEYIDSDTGFDVIRGYVKKDDNRLYLFVLFKFNGKIIKRIADHTVSALIYSGREV